MFYATLQSYISSDLLLWFSTGIILPGVYDDGQLWKALKALIPVHVGCSYGTISFALS